MGDLVADSNGNVLLYIFLMIWAGNSVAFIMTYFSPPGENYWTYITLHSLSELLLVGLIIWINVSEMNAGYWIITSAVLLFQLIFFFIYKKVTYDRRVTVECQIIDRIKRTGREFIHPLCFLTILAEGSSRTTVVQVRHRDWDNANIGNWAKITYEGGTNEPRAYEVIILRD
jgi:hypothetical protein